jgi:hypothetical protein
MARSLRRVVIAWWCRMVVVKDTQTINQSDNHSNLNGRDNDTYDTTRTAQTRGTCEGSQEQIEARQTDRTNQSGQTKNRTTTPKHKATDSNQTRGPSRSAQKAQGPKKAKAQTVQSLAPTHVHSFERVGLLSEQREILRKNAIASQNQCTFSCLSSQKTRVLFKKSHHPSQEQTNAPEYRIETHHDRNPLISNQSFSEGQHHQTQTETINETHLSFARFLHVVGLFSRNICSTIRRRPQKSSLTL